MGRCRLPSTLTRSSATAVPLRSCRSTARSISSVGRGSTARRSSPRSSTRHRAASGRSRRPLVVASSENTSTTRTCCGRASSAKTDALAFTTEAPAVLPLLGAEALEAIDRSVRWWRTWSARTKYDGPHRDLVVRSALALKLLAYAPSGAIVAAPTTSLPERLGGDLNWDYRYCWLRDAAFTARALVGLGYVEEAAAYVNWLVDTTALTSPKLRVLYDVYGTMPKGERALPELEGYLGSRPVRVGNLARDQ